MSRDTPLTPGTFDPAAAGGGGGGFSPTPWIVELLQIQYDADANDGGFVSTTPAVTYDPKREYFLIALDIGDPAAWPRPAAGPTIVNFLPNSSGLTAPGIFGPEALGTFTDATSGTIEIGLGEPNYFFHQIIHIPSGGVIGGPATIQGVVSAFHPSTLAFNMSTGALEKFWFGNGSGLTFGLFCLSRQVEP